MQPEALTIHQEQPADYPAIFKLIEAAFKTEPHSDQREQYLVERLRQSTAFIPELALVATMEKQIVGYILLTKIEIVNGATEHPALALAPVAVLPAWQGKGIGGQLIQAAHVKAQALGHRVIVLVGHQNYYPRFGYTRADQYGITFPFEVPPENGMVLALVEGGLTGVQGEVRYPAAFGL